MEKNTGWPARPVGPAQAAFAQRPIDAAALESLEPLILEELNRIPSAEEAGRRGLRVAAALKQVFARIFGTERSEREEATFLNFAAPHMRRILLRKATSTTGDSRIAGFGAVEVERWLVRLEALAPLQVRMIDLHYFSGLSEEETAAVLDVPLRTVTRDIRFVRAWLSNARRNGTGIG